MKKIDKIQQNSTLSGVEVANEETGLTPLQEKAVLLLISGKNVTEVANELQIDRSTLYNWIDKIPFKAFYNKQRKEINDIITNGLLSLYNEAIKAVKDGLKSLNGSVKLKAAFWLIERLESQSIGETDPRKMINNVCTGIAIDGLDLGISFDEAKYKQLCRENNINP